MVSKFHMTAMRRVLGILAVFSMVAGGVCLTSTEAQGPAAPAKKGSEAAGKLPATQAAADYVVAQNEISRTILVTGELQASRSRDILVPLTRMSSLLSITYLAPEGETIRQGERLIEFDNSSLLSQMTEQQRNVDESMLNIEKTKKDLEANRIGYLNTVAQAEGQLKIAKLNADIPVDIQPKNTWMKYQNDYEKAQLSLSRAKEQLANFEASYDSNIKLQELNKANAEIVLKRMQNDLVLLAIDAPQDGVVIYGDNWQANRRYQVGDQAFPNQPVIILPDLSQMQVTGFVYDTELQYLAPGMGCDIHLDAVPGRAFHGKITTLTSVATRKGFATTAKVFKAVIILDKVDLEVMKPGMTARAEVNISMGSDVLAVPRTHLALDSRGRYYVLKDNGPKTPASRELVKVGVFGDSMVQIVSGINVGDRLLQIQAVAEAQQ